MSACVRACVRSLVAAHLCARSHSDGDSAALSIAEGCLASQNQTEESRSVKQNEAQTAYAQNHHTRELIIDQNLRRHTNTTDKDLSRLQ